MHDAEIIQVITPPLFFCGVYYRRALCRFDGGVLALRNIQFSTRDKAEACRAGDWVLA